MSEKNYAILRLQKLKDTSKMKTAHDHNMRLYDVANADPEIENTELIRASAGDYVQMQEEYLAQLEAAGVPKYTIRKDAVKGFELILTTSRALSTDKQKEWEEANVKWLNERFNPRGGEAVVTDKDGKEIRIKTSNVQHAVVHNDEQTPHIHVFIVPVDDKGHLNAKYYTNGKYAMRQLQSDYAKAMEPFGLSRGVKGTVSSHQEVQRFYALQNSILKAELPQPQIGETANEYKARADEVYRAALAVGYKEKEELKQEKNELHAQKRDMKALLREGDPDELVREVKKIKRFEKGVEEYPDKEKAMQTKDNFNKIVDWEREQERLAEKKRKDREREDIFK